MIAGLKRPVLIDLCCSAGGASMGYSRAGFDVVGVDIEPQPNYPFPFLQMDALEAIERLGSGELLTFSGYFGSVDRLGLGDLAAVAASFPCQGYSSTRNFPGAKGAHRYIENGGRDALERLGLPYVMENVPGSPMPGALVLCGTEFGLRAPDLDGVTIELRRHRLFESNVFLWGAGGCDHGRGPVGTVMGAGGGNSVEYRDKARGKGYVPAVSVIKRLMDIDWMTKPELSQAIPPAYTHFIGAQLLEHLELLELQSPGRLVGSRS